MIDICFKTYDDDDGFELANLRWPCVPRVGEEVYLSGLVAGEHRGFNAAERPRSEELFVVTAVFYSCELDGEWLPTGEATIPDVEVWLAVKAGQSWPGATT